MSDQFNPYYEWLGIPAEERRPNHYQLLGIPPFEANPKVIENAADRQMSHLRTFQAGTHANESQRILNEVAAAKICLLKPEKKAAYDAQLRAKVGQRPATPPKTAQPLPAAPQAVPRQAAAIESFVVPQSALSDLRSERGSASRKGPSRGKKPASKGLGMYSMVVLVVGVVGLAAILWVRANHWQIQLVEADPASAAKKVERSKQGAKAKASSKKELAEAKEMASSDHAGTEQPPRSSSSVEKPDSVPQQPTVVGEDRPTVPERATPSGTASVVPNTISPTDTKPTPEAHKPAEPAATSLSPLRIEPRNMEPATDMKSNDVIDTSEKEPQTWRYTFDRPAKGWNKRDFKDEAWRIGPGGFGLPGDAGSVTRTLWNTSDIWLRRDFEVTDLGVTPSILRIFHDEDAEVFINGVLAAQFNGFGPGYIQVEIGSAARRAYKKGRNLLAVHCRQTNGWQYIDVGLITPLPIPKFRPFNETKAVRGKFIDLMKLIDPERDAFNGQWKLSRGVLTSPFLPEARLQIPFVPPSDYILTIIGEREAGEGLEIGVVIGGSQTLVVIDGWERTSTGIDSVDGQEANKNPTTNRIGNLLGEGRQYTIICTVRSGRFQATVNGNPVIQWSGMPERLALQRQWLVPHDDQLFIGAYKAIHHISSIKLVPLSPETKKKN